MFQGICCRSNCFGTHRLFTADMYWTSKDQALGSVNMNVGNGMSNG